MKKNHFHLFMCLIFLQPAWSQITITSSNMPGANDTIRYSNARINAVNVGLTGANFNWDFDSLKSISQGLYDYKSALNTPYAFYFFGLNKYGMKIADSIGVGSFKFTEVYNFYKKSNTTFQTEGIGFKYSGIPLAAYYTDADELYTFPLNYSDYDSSTLAFSIQLGTTFAYKHKGYRINYVDGWGTIKTPYGTANCLRLVSTSYCTDSIHYNGQGFSFPNRQRSYKWLSTAEKIPYLEVSGTYYGQFIPTQVRFRDNIQVFSGIEKNETSAEMFTCFPNPANNNIHIQSGLGSTNKINILDLNGNLVFTSAFIDKASISLPYLTDGLYFVQLIDAKNGIVNSCKKLIIQKEPF